MIIYFDIETALDENVVEQYLEKEIYDGGDFLDLEYCGKIMPNLWLDLFEEKIPDRFLKNYKFMPEFNKILTITVGTKTKDGNIIKNLPGTEEEQINAFFKAIEGNSICGFNIKGFDLPFIIKRALKYGIEIPNCIKFFGKKPWEMENIIDLQEVYRNGVFGASGSLDLVCNFLGITSPKDFGIDGSQVQKFYMDGKEEEILEYCKRDVAATIEVYNYFKKYNLI